MFSSSINPALLRDKDALLRDKDALLRDKVGLFLLKRHGKMAHLYFPVLDMHILYYLFI